MPTEPRPFQPAPASPCPAGPNHPVLQERAAGLPAGRAGETDGTSPDARAGGPALPDGRESPGRSAAIPRREPARLRGARSDAQHGAGGAHRLPEDRLLGATAVGGAWLLVHVPETCFYELASRGNHNHGYS